FGPFDLDRPCRYASCDVPKKLGPYPTCWEPVKTMPRTRPELNREDKMAEILEVAERRLRESGFEGLSMIGIARELGLAQNAIYWYFPSRAELFAAALRGILEGIAARKPRHSTNIVERVL